MTESKEELFDLIVRAMTNQWSNGKWSWWCRLPCGGYQSRDTREEAIADFIEWAKRPENQRDRSETSRKRLDQISSPGDGEEAGSVRRPLDTV